MKRIIFILFFIVVVIGAAAQTPTNGRITFTPLTVQPGSGDESYFEVSLADNIIDIKAYELDIVMPEGIDVIAKKNVYATIRKTAKSIYFDYYDDEEEQNVYTNHTLGSTYNNHVLRLSCVSLNNEDFPRKNGVLCRVYVKASAYAKPGTAEITIKNIHLTEADPIRQRNVNDCTDTNITIGTSATATLAVNATNQWSTCILPFATKLPEGVKAYECNEQDGDKLVLTKAESIEAYTPYLLYAPEGLDATTVTGTIDPTDYPEVGYVSKGYLSGALKSTNIFVGSYVLQNKGDGAKFYPVEFGKSFTMPAGKCWLNDKVISASALRLDTDYVLDGIETIHNEAKDNGNVYNLDGTMATTMQPGRLYIKGGNTILKIR